MPVLLQDYGVSLADMQDQGVVMQFQYPDKITGGTCYPMVTMDMSKFGKDNVQIATKYHFRGCPDTGDSAVPGSDSKADSVSSSVGPPGLTRRPLRRSTPRATGGLGERLIPKNVGAYRHAY